MYRLVLIFSLLASCSFVQNSLPIEGYTIDYGEALFKRQNQATFQVMMLLDEGVSEDDEVKLSTTELKMHEACHLLNEIARHEVNGETVSLYFKAQVTKSLKACDESVQNLEKILNEFDL